MWPLESLRFSSAEMEGGGQRGAKVWGPVPCPKATWSACGTPRVRPGDSPTLFWNGSHSWGQSPEGWSSPAPAPDDC